jgi:hypothetical protein
MKLELIEVLHQDQITLADVKRALRITGTGHDAELLDILNSARAHIERMADTTVGQKSWKVTTEFEYDEDTLPRGPVSDLEEEEDDGKNVYEYTGGFEDGIIPGDLKRLILVMCKKIYDMDDMGTDINSEFTRLLQTLTRQPML